MSIENVEILFVNEHKHIGMIMDSQVNCQNHIRATILKARRGIGIIRYLFKYVSRDILNFAYKLCGRSHLDYGDILYHRYDLELQLNVTKKLNKCSTLRPWQLLVQGQVQVGKDFITSWDRKTFTVEDGTIICVTFSS